MTVCHLTSAHQTVHCSLIRITATADTPSVQQSQPCLRRMGESDSRRKGKLRSKGRRSLPEVFAENIFSEIT